MLSERVESELKVSNNSEPIDPLYLSFIYFFSCFVDFLLLLQNLNVLCSFIYA